MRGGRPEADVEYVGIGMMAALAGDDESAFRFLLGAQRVAVDGRAMLVVMLAERAQSIEKISAMDVGGDPVAARLMGMVAACDRDEPAAMAAFNRADQRGDALGAVACGTLLRRRNSPGEAEAAFQRASDRGSALGAALLSVARWQRGDGADWRAAWSRAADLGFDCKQFPSPLRTRLLGKLRRALLHSSEVIERWVERHGGDPDQPKP